jgi:hypothetical protein
MRPSPPVYFALACQLLLRANLILSFLVFPESLSYIQFNSTLNSNPSRPFLTPRYQELRLCYQSNARMLHSAKLNTAQKIMDIIPI